MFRIKICGITNLADAAHLAASGADAMGLNFFPGSKRCVARDMAAELGPQGIRVNTVVPTWMWGPNVKMYCDWQAAERGCSAEEVRDEIALGMALRKMPTDADVAGAAIFFASDRASMITGQGLLVNAGEFYDT